MKKILLLFSIVVLTHVSLFCARPQTPYPPYPYDTIEYKVANKDILLSGTLTLPIQPKAAIVLATGSGSQNRDEEIFNHRPFKVIADYLTRFNYAVLRMDDRGVGASSGDPTTSTTDDYVGDIKEAVKSLRAHEKLKGMPVGIIGHSEGGLIAIKSADSADFIVTLAAPALRGDSVILTQAKALLEASNQGYTWTSLYPTLRQRYDWVMSDMPTQILKLQLYNNIVKDIPSALLTDDLIARIIAEISSMTSPWYRSFLRYDPANDICKVEIPWLALNGDKDLQIICDQNLLLIEKLNPNVKIVKFDNLNHLFQECSTGMINEYEAIDQTISPNVLKTIQEWLDSVIVPN